MIQAPIISLLDYYKYFPSGLSLSVPHNPLPHFSPRRLTTYKPGRVSLCSTNFQWLLTTFRIKSKILNFVHKVVRDLALPMFPTTIACILRLQIHPNQSYLNSLNTLCFFPCSGLHTCCSLWLEHSSTLSQTNKLLLGLSNLVSAFRNLPWLSWSLLVSLYNRFPRRIECSSFQSLYLLIITKLRNLFILLITGFSGQSVLSILLSRSC